jgi:vitamin B12 transporter
MRIFSTFLGVCLGFVLHAQDDTLRPLATVEVTSKRLLHYAVGQQVTVVDSADLAAFGQRMLSDFLSQHTALDVRTYGAGSVTMATRGGAAAHTAFLWNGINLQNSLSGIFDLSIVPLNGVSHLSLKTGGESALFGGGALSSVVFIDNSIAEKKGIHGAWTGLMGSFDDWRQQARVSIGNGRWATQIAAGHQRADNDFPFRNTAALGRPIQRQVNARQISGNVLHSIFGQINAQTTLQTHLWYQQTERQIPPTMTAVNDLARQGDYNWRGVLVLAHQAKAGLWHGRLAFTDDLLVYNSNTVNDSRNRGLNRIAELEYEARPSRRWGYRVGTNFTQNLARSNNFDARHQRDRLAIFTSQTIDFESLKLNVNARQEMVERRFAPLTASLGWEQQIGQHKLPFVEKNRLVWRGSAARNYNLPALNDLYWAVLGNPSLRPESSWSAETGLDWTMRSAHGFSAGAQVTAYTMRIQDRIQWSPGNDGVWRPSNLFRSKSAGLEIAGQSQYVRAHWRVTTKAAYQWTRAVNAAGFQLLYVPRHTAQANCSVQYRQLSVQWRRWATDGCGWYGFYCSFCLVAFGRSMGFPLATPPNLVSRDGTKPF